MFNENRQIGTDILTTRQIIKIIHENKTTYKNLLINTSIVYTVKTTLNCVLWFFIMYYYYFFFFTCLQDRRRRCRVIFIIIF